MYLFISSYYLHILLPSSCLPLHLCFPQLAEQGMNIVIISRTRESLDQVAKEISKNLTYVCFWITATHV